MRARAGAKPCGHPAHPEDGNVGLVRTVSAVRAERAADVAAHRSDPSWFVGRYVKAGFVIREGEPSREWMWVLVSAATPDGGLAGILKNDPLQVLRLRDGQEVTVAMADVLDVLDR